MTQLITAGVMNHPAEVAPGVFRIITGISNAYMVAAEDQGWVQVDAGGNGYGKRIIKAAREIFGPLPPRAILLTHAHFDHAGGLPELRQEWRVPVYAHKLEMPYLRMNRRYPPGDPTVHGFMPEVSRMIDTSRPTPAPFVHVLPLDFAVPELPEWRWMETPGHTPGHVSFYRPGKRILIAGDAVITVNSDSVIGMATQKREFSHPPAYATYDWVSARESVMRLAQMEPHYVLAGHGTPISGEDTPKLLVDFAGRFRHPTHGRYVRRPAEFDESGPTYIPPQAVDTVGLGVGTAVGFLLGFGIGRALARR